MNHIQISIDTNNDSFDGMGLYREVQQIFLDLSDKFDGESTPDNSAIQDSNGNTVGGFKWTSGDDHTPRLLTAAKQYRDHLKTTGAANGWSGSPRVTELDQLIADVQATDDPPKFRNYYECPNCGSKWADEWTCQCNDRCPKCNKEIQPCDSEDITK